MKVLGLSFLAAVFFSGAAMATGGGSVSSTTPFNNHLRSSMMVSPAQIYQTPNMKSDFQLGYTVQEGSTDAAAEVTDTVSLTDIYGAAVYSFPDTGATLGFEASYGMGTFENDAAR